MSEEIGCQTCKRKDCLRNEYKIFRNVPQSSEMYGKVKHVTRAKIWRYLDQIKIGGKMPVINKLRTFFGICPISIVKDETFEFIRRWSYCKSYPSVPPFPGGYDNQLQEWIWISNIIEDELSILREHGRKD